MLNQKLLVRSYSREQLASRKETWKGLEFCNVNLLDTQFEHIELLNNTESLHSTRLLGIENSLTNEQTILYATQINLKTYSHRI